MHEIKKIILTNNTTVHFRLLSTTDSETLHLYLQNLSAESRSRFGPHPFDKDTVDTICKNLRTDTERYIAVNVEKIIAYMLIKKGMTEADRQRYADRNLFFNEDDTVTYAPSVADEWQNTGLGSKMFELIKNELYARGIKNIILWGGVQESNLSAVHFYTKYGFKFIASFWNDNKNNLDMVLTL